MAFKDVLAKQAAVGTVRYTLDTLLLGCDQSPVLVLRYAGKSNPGYQSAILKVANERRSRQGSGKLTERSVDADRKLDAEIFAKHVVVGWENVWDDGKPAPFTAEKVLELLGALVDDHDTVFAALTAYARDPENFRDSGATAGTDLGKG